MPGGAGGGQRTGGGRHGLSLPDVTDVAAARAVDHEPSAPAPRGARRPCRSTTARPSAGSHPAHLGASRWRRARAPRRATAPIHQHAAPAPSASTCAPARTRPADAGRREPEHRGRRDRGRGQDVRRDGVERHRGRRREDRRRAHQLRGHRHGERGRQRAPAPRRPAVAPAVRRPARCPPVASTESTNPSSAASHGSATRSSTTVADERRGRAVRAGRAAPRARRRGP